MMVFKLLFEPLGFSAGNKLPFHHFMLKLFQTSLVFPFTFQLGLSLIPICHVTVYNYMFCPWISFVSFRYFYTFPRFCVDNSNFRRNLDVFV